MKSTVSFLLVAALLAGTGACRKDDKAAQLLALEKAYSAGVFTREEYEVKKQTLLGTPATPPPAVTPVPVAADANPSAIPADPSGAAGVPTPPPATPPAGVVPAAQPQSAPQPAVTQPPVQPTPSAQQNQSTPPPPVMPRSRPSAPAVAPPSAARPNANAEEEPAPLAGCEDPEAKKSGGPKGLQERFYPASVEAVHQAAQAAFQNMDFAIHADTASDMEASKRRHLGVVIAGGERLLLHFSRSSVNGQSGTRVTAETKKTFVGRITQKSWTTAVLAQIGCNLRARR